jgi:hypothetical protein
MYTHKDTYKVNYENGTAGLWVTTYERGSESSAPVSCFPVNNHVFLNLFNPVNADVLTKNLFVKFVKKCLT